jgi:hypothetical protein
MSGVSRSFRSTTDLDLQVVVEVLSKSRLKQADAVLAGPHVRSDVPEQLVVGLPVRREMHAQTPNA